MVKKTMSDERILLKNETYQIFLLKANMPRMLCRNILFRFSIFFAAFILIV